MPEERTIDVCVNVPVTEQREIRVCTTEMVPREVQVAVPCSYQAAACNGAAACGNACVSCR